ncbi:50S ribosomal protein L6 [Candidatus Woesearchaeota archaeon]|nr:50S ribosomal protein L6 [Nanoarchaeota archaeon]MCB9369977.1 50S ribosomal protein L6 [Candidatus Woesearchaeota archaeon]USN44513.1 MAG: 50S ribosomal protein L6 [Candidatus Woesearchaeota archaeon]
MVEIKKAVQKPKVWETLEVKVPLSSGVSAAYDGKILTVKGPKGEVSKRLKYPYVSLKVEGNEVIIFSEHCGKREKKIIFTFQAHTTNLVKGVSEGFEYKLAVVYAKFPITAELKGQEFIVKNLLGEKVPRTVMLPADVKVSVNGKDILVSGIDKEKVGQAAASLEQLTRITHMDRRVIQDGIYITEKPHRVYS